eukprot:TRINITY_DN6328_c0_g3_i1.p3 TRINITY_DN6328_c0_g3~~TRINITY_DN6328_c0_g3_i1.p3  ORF type:complete len:211 (+),score=7.68 TRINITY_DN6328_c0_g3_i1:118-750(+)
MIRRPPRSTHCISSAASDVYKRQVSTQSTWDYRPVLVHRFIGQIFVEHYLGDVKSLVSQSLHFARALLVKNSHHGLLVEHQRAARAIHFAEYLSGLHHPGLVVMFYFIFLGTIRKGQNHRYHKRKEDDFTSCLHTGCCLNLQKYKNDSLMCQCANLLMCQFYAKQRIIKKPVTLRNRLLEINSLTLIQCNRVMLTVGSFCNAIEHQLRQL